MKSKSIQVLVTAFIATSSVTVLAGPGLDLIRMKYTNAQSDVALFDDSLVQGTYDQNLDHQGTATFKQRYFLNSRFASGPDAPVLFEICGEGACRAPSGALLAHASELKAYAVSLEHRYYGQSIPFKSLSTSNLKYLSTDLAIKDLASFQKWASESLKLHGKWISIGGSYSGSLSAYYREKHPELVVGALASSGPVRALVNFDSYDAHVNKVAGPDCAAKMRTVVAEIDKARVEDREKFKIIKAGFKAEGVNDDIDFLGVVADIGAGAVQYGMRDEFCQKLSSSATPLAGYQFMADRVYGLFGENAVGMSPQGAMSEDSSNYSSDIGMRQWIYQTCTEYGYFQTAYHDASQSTRSPSLTPDYAADICKRLFGITSPVNEAATNETYFIPLNSPATSNILFTNGANDPWSVLSITPGQSTSPNVQTVLITGAAHCDDLRNSRAGDSAELTAARAKFLTLAKKWLGL